MSPQPGARRPACARPEVNACPPRPATEEALSTWRPRLTVRSLVLMAGLLLAGTTPAVAQVWDAPSFMSPRPGEDVGLYVINTEDADVGFAGIWRQSGNLNLGLRAGLAGGDHISAGAEFHGPLNLVGSQSGLLLAWTAGIGATFNDALLLRTPFGISAGVSLGTPGGLVLTPYVHPRFAIELLVQDDADGVERSESDVTFDIDIAADAVLSDAFVLRAGVMLGRRTSFGAGLAYRIPRRIAVR